MVPGLRALFSGQVSRFRDKLQLTHPEFEPLEESEGVRPFISIYPATQGFDSWQIARCVRQVLELLDDPTDPLPASLRRAEGLSDLGRALRRIHVPETEADQYAAKNRLVWDEAMGVQLALALRRKRAVQRPAAANPHVPGGLLDAFDAPAALHADRRPAVGRRRDRRRPRAPRRPMNRLVQGDVGAGKTVVALRAMLQVVDSGRQAAMLAPTEVLAAQHARSLRSLLGPLAQAGELGGAEQATRVTLLSGSLVGRGEAEGAAGGAVRRGRDRRRHARADPGPGRVRRAGAGGGRRAAPLRRRAARRPARARRAGSAPAGDDGHPDPAHGGDDGVRRPRGVGAARAARRPVADRDHGRAGGGEAGVAGAGVGADPRGGRGRAPGVRRVPAGGRRHGQGRTELPDDPDDAGAGTDERRAPLAVLEVAPKLAEGPLAGLRLGVLHGKLPPDEKDTVMRAFDAGELDVLVATTVIEVGVDVPNSTAMVIMDADRFGLSQLHQLRGRVGRGSAPGVCLLVTDMPAGTTARERLDAVASTTDGFELARMDLELRREGDVLGSLQSGRRSGLRLLSLLRHEEIIAKARGLRHGDRRRRPRPGAAPGPARAGGRDRGRRGARGLPRQGLSAGPAAPVRPGAGRGPRPPAPPAPVRGMWITPARSRRASSLRARA